MSADSVSSQIYVRRFGVGLIAAVLGAVLLVDPAPVWSANPRTANPSPADPVLPLAIHGDEVSVRLHDEGQERCALLAKKLPALVERDRKGQIEKVDPDDLSACHVANVQLGRIGRGLKARGEPCGFEFTQRATHYQSPILQLVAKFNMTPPGQRAAVQARQRVAKSERERAATFKRIQELIQKKQEGEAEQALYDLYDKVMAFLVFLPPDEQRPVLEAFRDVQLHLQSVMDARRSSEGQAVLAQRLAAERPAVAEFVGQITTATQQLSATGQASIDGMALAGPAAFTHFVGTWQALHARAIRYQGLAWARSASTGSMTPLAPLAGGNEQEKDPILSEYQNRSAAQISQALAGLIVGDAERISPTAAPARYVEWLEAIAPHVGRVANDELRKAVEPALARLAARSPEFAAQVAAYDDATRDLLRWRRRVAEATAAARVDETPVLEKAFQTALASTQEFQGLFAFQETEWTHPSFIGTAPEVLPVAGHQLLNQAVVLVAGQGLAGGKSSVTRLRLRTFASLKADAGALAAAASRLSQDLLVTPQSPPLTLDAASALRSLEAGDFTACGGAITNCHLEGFVTRIAGLPDAAWPVVPLGALPDGGLKNVASEIWLAQAAMRFEVAPVWWRHEYAFVPMSAAP